MLKTICFVPDPCLISFIRPTELMLNIYKPDIFNFYSRAPKLNKDEEADHLGTPTELGSFL